MSRSKDKHSGPADKNQLKLLLKKLEEAAFQVGETLSSEKSSNDYLCLVVLEDDLSCLLEECRSYLLGPELPSSAKLVSFESRCMTVLDEVELALGGDPDAPMHSFSWDEVVPASYHAK